MHPFDPQTVFLAKHAQHVVLIHFPIALFISAVGFEFLALVTKRTVLEETAYYNLLAAALFTPLVLITGGLAWRLQLEGQKIKGILLLHLVFAIASATIIWLVCLIHYRARKRRGPLPVYRLPLEIIGVAVIAITGHLGGFLSGVNGPG
jgi:uncharacterized membrane protein